MFDLDRLCMGCMGDNEGQEICPVCGFDKAAPTPPHALDLKTVLQNRYIVGKMLIYGGDGITYLGFDKVEEKIVRIKEYYPAGVCQRKDGVAVRVKKDSAFAYNSGIMDFLELSEKLRSLSDLSGIYPVINVFEENGTAYRVTKHTHGINLRDYLLRQGGTLTWEQAKPLFMPLISTLIRLHKIGIIHRAISPETLIVGRDGKLRITDFSISSVRTTKGDLAPQLYAGYAAIEQYGHAKTEDGVHTDVYGLAATLFKALIGNPPAEATQRIENDNMSFPKRLADEIPHNVLIALANALQIMPSDRTTCMEEFKRDLSDDDDEILPVIIPKKEKTPKAKKEAAPKKEAPKVKKQDKILAIKAAAITAGALIVVIAIILAIFWPYLFPEEPTKNPNLDDLTSLKPNSSQVIMTPSNNEKTYEVDDFTGKTFAEISGDAKYSGQYSFKVAAKEYSDTVPKGKIIRQEPARGSQVTKNSVISVYVSLGPEKIMVPNLKGKEYYKEARLALLELGIDPEAIEKRDFYDDSDPSIAVGEVIKTNPAIGSFVSKDERIVVFVKASNETSSGEQPEQ